MNKKDFDKAVEEWIEYCKTPKVHVSSNPKTITECGACKKILAMNYEALPLIRNLYDTNSSNNFALTGIQGLGLVQLVHDIVGDEFQIPKDIRGNISKMESYTKNWLDENINKYL